MLLKAMPTLVSRQFKIAEVFNSNRSICAVNPDNTVGVIGFVSRTFPSVYPISIIRVDPETGDALRDSKGLCIPCKPGMVYNMMIILMINFVKIGEPGVFIGKIIAGDPIRAFLGYVDKSASEKKIVRDVFKHGDSAFLSGIFSHLLDLQFVV